MTWLEVFYLSIDKIYENELLMNGESYFNK